MLLSPTGSFPRRQGGRANTSPDDLNYTCSDGGTRAGSDRCTGSTAAVAVALAAAAAACLRW